MAAWSIVRRDLLRLVREPGRPLLLLAMPLMLAAIFALVFAGGGAEGIKIRVLLHDEDESFLSNLLQGVGSNPQASQLEVVAVGEEGYAMMEEGEASALIHIPKGFGDAVIDGRPTAFGLVKNPSERFLPQVVEEGLGLGATLLSQGTRLLRPELEKIEEIAEAESAPSDAMISLLSVGINQKLRHVGEYVFPPVLVLDTVTVDDEDEARPDVGIMSFLLPGLSILGLLFIAQSVTRDIQREREAGLVRQLMTAPLSPTDYLLGKCLSVLVITVLAFAVFLALGFAVDIDWGEPVAAAALVVASALGISGFLLFLMSLAKSERAGDALSTVVILVFSLLGGSFVPVSQLPDFVLPLSKLTLTYWATSGFNTLILEGGALADIVPNLLVLGGTGLACLMLGARLIKRRIDAGAS